MDSFSFKYGTAKPVRFRETMGTNKYDVDLEARMACTINVTNFDETKYAGQEELITAVKAKMYEITEKSLEELATRSVMLQAMRRGQLAKALERNLLAEGVKAEVDVFSFALTRESQEKYDELEEIFRKDMLNDFAIDRTDRPCPGYMEKFKPDCVLQGAPGFSMEKYVADCKAENRCPFCRTERLPGAKFCTECGRKFEDADQVGGQEK